MINCIEVGDPHGAPVLFLHAGSYSGTMWRDIAERLPDMCCILPDLPGHGFSRDIVLHSLEHAADDVAALITGRYDGRAVNLVGLSFGGYIGLMLTVRHPHLVRRAMLSGIHLGAIPHARAMTFLAALMSPLIRFRWVRRKLAAPLGITDPTVFERADGRANLSPGTLRAVLRLVSVFTPHARLADINVPTLFLAGANEHATIVNSLGEFERRMPQATARVVPRMGHAWCNEDPDLFAETLRAWITNAELPGQLDRPS